MINIFGIHFQLGLSEIVSHVKFYFESLERKCICCSSITGGTTLVWKKKIVPLWRLGEDLKQKKKSSRSTVKTYHNTFERKVIFVCLLKVPRPVYCIMDPSAPAGQWTDEKSPMGQAPPPPYNQYPGYMQPGYPPQQPGYPPQQAVSSWLYKLETHLTISQYPKAFLLLLSTLKLW